MISKIATWLNRRRPSQPENLENPEVAEAPEPISHEEAVRNLMQSIKNRCVLDDPTRPAREQRVNLDYWRPGEGAMNLGDYLSIVICEWMVQRKGLSFDDPVSETKFLAAVGSILQLGLNDCTVWGSGLLWDECPEFIDPETKSMDIRALRGPETKRVLADRGYQCPDVFGDPAVLMPLIYQPSSQEKTRSHLAILHMYNQEGSDVDITTSDYRGFIDAIASSRLVVSSSLHGVILSEAYGVPAVLLDDGRPDFTLHKYRDWYLSTGRSDFPVAHSIEEALELAPAPLPDLSDMQKALTEAFPYDLWE